MFKNIQILKICGSSVCKPLEITLQSCLENGTFPSEWRKINIIPVRKKNDEQLLKKYCPISLPPICATVIERLIYDKMFDDEREARSAFLEKNGTRNLSLSQSKMESR